MLRRRLRMAPVEGGLPVAAASVNTLPSVAEFATTVDASGSTEGMSVHPAVIAEQRRLRKRAKAAQRSVIEQAEEEQLEDLQERHALKSLREMGKCFCILCSFPLRER